MNNIAIIGAGITTFGESWDKSLRDMILEASLLALSDAGLAPKNIDAIFIGNMLGSKTAGQSHLGSLVATQLGIDVDSTRVEAACASGGLAILRAIESIQSGRHETVLVVGAEKMSDLSNGEITNALMEAGDEEWEMPYGATFAGLYALMAKIHMQKYHTTERQLAEVAVKNHYHASLNSHAHFRNTITVEQVLASPPVATPLKLLDCCPNSDGGAAVILTSKRHVKSHHDPVFVLGAASATDTLSLAQRAHISEIRATQKASQQALKEAGVTQKDIDVLEVHDCFTIAEIMALEDMEFYKKGAAAKAIQRGETKLGGKLPVNVSGGLKAAGHPVGATGVKQAVEIVTQLRGKAQQRQVKNAKIGLTHNVGGTGATCVVHIFGKEDHA